MTHTKRLEEGGGMQHFRDALARVIREKVEFLPGILVTVLEAKLTRDTKHAKCVISVLPENMENTARKILIDSDHDIKEGLSETLRLRRIPRLHWEFDHTEAQAEKIEETLNILSDRGEI